MLIGWRGESQICLVAVIYEIVSHPLSGGQKQRLFIALINDPEVVFLDELTTGLRSTFFHWRWGPTPSATFR